MRRCDVPSIHATAWFWLLLDCHSRCDLDCCRVYRPWYQKMPQASRILVLAPHQDDEVLGCGGTVCLYSSRGAEVKVVYLGEAAIDSSVRDEETEGAAKHLGIKWWCSCKGDVGMAKSILAAMLDGWKPDIILVPSFSEAHPLHLEWAKVFADVSSINAEQWRLWLYEVWVPTPYNLVVDITPFAEQKRNALRCYDSQLQRYPLEDLIFGLDRAHAAACLRRIEYAEVFLELSSLALGNAMKAWRYFQHICHSTRKCL